MIFSIFNFQFSIYYLHLFNIHSFIHSFIQSIDLFNLLFWWWRIWIICLSLDWIDEFDETSFNHVAYDVLALLNYELEFANEFSFDCKGFEIYDLLYLLLLLIKLIKTGKWFVQFLYLQFSHSSVHSNRDVKMI